MSIKDQLTADMKQAMKDREAGKLRLSVIRMVRANIKNVEINDKKELTDDEVLAVLMKEVKMRQDSVEEFQKAGRDELVAQAKEEIAILKKYLPEALSDDELKAIVAEVIAAVGATSPKDIFFLTCNARLFIVLAFSYLRKNACLLGCSFKSAQCAV